MRKPGREATTDMIAKRLARRMRKGQAPTKGRWLVGKVLMTAAQIFDRALAIVRDRRTART
jgi:hypothetical protein